MIKDFFKPSLKKVCITVLLIFIGMGFFTSLFVGIFKSGTGTPDPPIVQWLFSSSGCYAMSGSGGWQCYWYGINIGNTSWLSIVGLIFLVGGLISMILFTKYESEKKVKQYLIAITAIVLLIIISLIFIGYLYSTPSMLTPL